MYTTTNLTIFGLVILANVVFLEKFILEYPLSPSSASTAGSVNSLLSGLAQNEYILSALFNIFVNNGLARLAPLPVRLLFARFYCYGHIHSGCAVAGLFWSSVVYRLESRPGWRHPAGLWTSLTQTICLTLMILLALPLPTKRRHPEYFEWLDRVLSITVNAIACYRTVIQPPRKDEYVQYVMLALDILLQMDPWAYLKSHSVQVKFLSMNALQLTFSKGLGCYGKTIRITNTRFNRPRRHAMFPDLKNIGYCDLQHRGLVG